MSSDTTSLRVSKRTLARFNQLRAEEAGDRGGVYLEQNEFLKFLLKLYSMSKNNPDYTGEFLIERVRIRAD